MQDPHFLLDIVAEPIQHLRSQALLKFTEASQLLKHSIFNRNTGNKIETHLCNKGRRKAGAAPAIRLTQSPKKQESHRHTQQNKLSLLEGKSQLGAAEKYKGVNSVRSQRFGSVWGVVKPKMHEVLGSVPGTSGTEHSGVCL